MRREKLLGQNHMQLVVPASRRQQCLEFGHDLADHMSPKKVSQRIRLNFLVAYNQDRYLRVYQTL